MCCNAGDWLWALSVILENGIILFVGIDRQRFSLPDARIHLTPDRFHTLRKRHVFPASRTSADLFFLFGSLLYVNGTSRITNLSC